MLPKTRMNAGMENTQSRTGRVPAKQRSMGGERIRKWVLTPEVVRKEGNDEDKREAPEEEEQHEEEGWEGAEQAGKLKALLLPTHHPHNVRVITATELK